MSEIIRYTPTRGNREELEHRRAAVAHQLRLAAPRISSILSPITLDALTVADDPGFLDRVAAQGNLPAGLAPALLALYQG